MDPMKANLLSNFDNRSVNSSSNFYSHNVQHACLGMHLSFLTLYKANIVFDEDQN